MGNLASISAKIPIEWLDAIAAKGKPSAIVRLALAEYLGLVEEIYRDGIPAENPLRSELDEIKARLSELERYISEIPVYQESSPIAAVTKPKPTTPPPLDGAMRSGELLIALQARGYKHKESTLLRLLNRAIDSGVVPDELARFGVRCDFEAKRSANPRSSNLRWLRIED